MVERGETDLRNDFNLNFLESIVMTNKQLLIVGDFNIHTDILDYPDAIKFSDLMESFSLQQHVSGPTHIHGHMLDLIITRQTDNQNAPSDRSIYIRPCFCVMHDSFR